MTQPKTPPDYNTPAERLLLARIRLKAAKYELGLLKTAVRKGKLPTADTYIRRMIAATFNRAFQ
jgi:hypothetical protein